MIIHGAQPPLCVGEKVIHLASDFSPFRNITYGFELRHIAAHKSTQARKESNCYLHDETHIHTHNTLEVNPTHTYTHFVANLHLGGLYLRKSQPTQRRTAKIMLCGCWRYIPAGICSRIHNIDGQN